MPITVLLQLLQSMLEQHGDLPVRAGVGETGFVIRDIRFIQHEELGHFYLLNTD